MKLQPLLPNGVEASNHAVVNDGSNRWALEAKISARRDDVSHVEPWCIMLPVPPQVAVIGAFSAQKIPIKMMFVQRVLFRHLKAW